MGRLGILVAVLAASFVMAVGPVRAEWQRAHNKHFILYGDMSTAALQRMAEKLERFDNAMRFFTKATETVPVTIYMVSNLDEVRRLSGRRGVGGYYRGSAQEPFVVVPLDTGPEHRFSISAEDVLFHEYAHHMLLSNNDQYLPAWTNEGMAEFFMSASLKDDGSVVIGAPNQSRAYSMFTLSRWTARELLLSETKNINASEIDQRYARGWLLVHYLLISGERPNQLTNYINELNTGIPIADAATAVFGDLGKLDSDLQRYSRRSTFGGLRLTQAELGTPDKVTITPLSAGAAAIMPYRVVSANGVTPAMGKDLAQKARGVAARYPADAFVQRALAEMEYDAGRMDETVAAADRAIAADPANVMAMVYKGRVFARRAKAANDMSLWKEARSWFLKANRADPNHPMPFISFYDTFVAAGQKPSEGAETGLLRAIVLVPQDVSIHIRLALQSLRKDDLKGARAMLGVAAYAPHTGGENPARDAMKMMDEGATAKHILEKVGSKLVITDFDVAEDPVVKEREGGEKDIRS
jgi:tetratricopeptide (TPR) repeat protein